jgi:phage recombination protein Bet
MDSQLDHKKEIEIITPVGKPVKITFNEVKQVLCPTATDAEIILFLNQAQAFNLNPFVKEIELIKYTATDPAVIRVSMEARLKVAEHRPEFIQSKAGIIIKPKNGQAQFIEGTFYDKDAVTLVGGWAKVWTKKQKEPVYSAVHLTEVTQYTKDGAATRFWRTMPATMCRKVAYYRALREAFPSLFAGPSSVEASEAAAVVDGEFQETHEPPKTEPLPDGAPNAFLDAEGKPRWDFFWAKLKEQFGISHDIALSLLKISSFAEIYHDDLGQAWEDIVAALNKGKPATPPTEPATESPPKSETAGTPTEEPAKSAEPSESDIMFENLESATQKPPVDADWVKTTIFNLRKNGCTEVTGNKLAERWRQKYNVKESLGGLSIKQSLTLLLRPDAEDLCKWLQELEEKYPAQVQK